MAVDSSSSAVKTITSLHQAALLGLAFFGATILYGGPFGVLPAEAALLAEIRAWRATGVPLPGAFARLFRRARTYWRAALPGGELLVGASALLEIGHASPMPGPALTVAGALWLLIAAQHRAALLSLGLSGWRGWRIFVLCAWRDLLAVLLWGGLLLLSPLPVLPLALLFGPTVIGFLLIGLEGPLPRGLAPASPDDENV
jgi:hypothetical protein